MHRATKVYPSSQRTQRKVHCHQQYQPCTCHCQDKAQSCPFGHTVHDAELHGPANHGREHSARCNFTSNTSLVHATANEAHNCIPAMMPSIMGRQTGKRAQREVQCHQQYQPCTCHCQEKAHNCPSGPNRPRCRASPTCQQPKGRTNRTPSHRDVLLSFSSSSSSLSPPPHAPRQSLTVNAWRSGERDCQVSGFTEAGRMGPESGTAETPAWMS